MKVNYRGMVSGVALLAGIGYPMAASAQTANPDAAPAAAPQAAEQPAEPEEGEVIVTGIRSSLRSAADIKRGASSIVDVISAEDMGSFPDQNIAESLQRVTGVQIQRDRGEGRDISIRGLDPKFSRITLNGDGLISISPIGGLNPNGAPGVTRSFDFTTLGSDFVQTLVVSKSATADQEEGGLAGSVDGRTVKPLDLKKSRVTLQVEGYRNGYAKKVGPHVSGTYTGQFFDNTLGVSFGVDYSKRYLETQSYQSSGQDSRQENQLRGQGGALLFTNTGSTGTAANTLFTDWNGDGDNLDAYRFNHLVQFQEDTGVRTRKTYNLSLQWKPDPRWDFNFAGIYGDYKTRFTNAAYTFQTHLGGDPTLTGNRVRAATISGIAPFAGDVVGNGTAGRTTCTSVAVTPATGCVTQLVPPNQALPISGLIDSYSLRGALVDNITKFNEARIKTGQAQLGIVYNADNFRVETRGSYVSSKRDAVLNAGMDGFSYKDVTYDQRTDLSGIPTVGYGPGADPLNASTYNSGSAFFTGFVVPQEIKQRMGTIDLNWHTTPFEWLSSVKVGYKHSKMALDQAVTNIDVKAAQFATLSNDTLTSTAASNGLKAGGINLTNYMTTFGGSNFLSRYRGNSTFPTTWIAPDVDSLLDKYSLDQLTGLPGGLVRQPAQQYQIREITNAGYVRADFSFLDDALTMNTGVRVVHTKSVATGFTGDPASLVQSNVSTLSYTQTNARLQAVRNYWSVLPSLNIKYNVTDKAIIRAAASRTVTRPDFGNLVPSNSGNVSLVTQTATIANTQLKPYYSTNFDLGGELYFGRDSMLSVALFHKSIDGYLVTRPGTLTLNYIDLAKLPATVTVTTNQAFNGSSTTTKGVEIAFQQPFTFLPGALSGFGTLLNYTFTDAGKITAGTGTSGVQTAAFGLPFVSKHAANAVLYYEKYGLSARAAYVWRSKFTEIAGGVGLDSRGGSYVKSAGYLDLSSKYQLTPNIAITLDAVNVLDTPVERVNVYGFGRGFEVNGRTLTLGARVTF